MKEMANAYKILVGKPEGNKSLGGSRHRLDNIKMNFKETESRGWTGFN
jgi:hypothetical protein